MYPESNFCNPKYFLDLKSGFKNPSRTAQLVVRLLGTPEVDCLNRGKGENDKF